MWNYPDRIQESVDTLLAQERRLRRSAIADRVKMLRLLKSGRYRSQTQLAPLLGHSDRTLRRWWQLYQQQGLAGLLADPVSDRESITAQARQNSLEEARSFLKRQLWDLYQGVSGLSRW